MPKHIPFLFISNIEIDKKMLNEENFHHLINVLRLKSYDSFVAVDNKYDGLIPTNELFQDLNYVDIIEARVKNVRQNGRLELSLRKEIPLQIDIDVKFILEKLAQNNGKIMLNDNSDPARIKETLNMSKSSFKRAVGRLFKERKIIITENGISLV